MKTNNDGSENQVGEKRFKKSFITLYKLYFDKPMEKFVFFLFLTFILGNLRAQEIVSVTYGGYLTKTEISNYIGLPVAQYDCDYFKVTYKSKDAKGNLDTLSALLAIPVEDVSNTYPLLFYEHGTSSCKECVPSRFPNPEGEEGYAGIFFASLGYVALLPDYVGMGDGSGFQSYVHDTTSFTASVDLLNAFKTWAPDNNIIINDQLFITGYSQGGYSSMSFHKEMQNKYGPSSVTAAAHNSGPYSLSGVMRDLVINDSVYSSPAYIPNTVLGLNEVYEMYSNLDEFFKPEFINVVQKYYNGEISLFLLNQNLILTLNSLYGEAIANKMIINSVMDEFINNPDYIINKVLRDNDVFDWTPESPTRLFYCKADDQVPYKNAIEAINKMYSNGADQQLVQAIDLGESLDHGGCYYPSLFETMLFFDNYKDNTSGVEDIKGINITIFPNPTSKKILLDGNSDGNVNVKIFDMNGKLKVDISSHNLTNEIDVSSLDNGVYIIQIENKEGATSYRKFVVGK